LKPKLKQFAVENRGNYFSVENTGLTETDYAKIISVFERFAALEKVVLYGSRAKGNYSQYSDIDIVLAGNGLDLKIKQHIELALDDLYLPYYFDVSILSKIDNADLVAHINRVGIEIYKNSTFPQKS